MDTSEVKSSTFNIDNTVDEIIDKLVDKLVVSLKQQLKRAITRNEKQILKRKNTKPKEETKHHYVASSESESDTDSDSETD